MQEISTRFSKESGSEEILIPHQECEQVNIYGGQDETMDDDMDDYSPPSQRVQPANRSSLTHLPITTNTTQSNYILPSSSVLGKSLV